MSKFAGFPSIEGFHNIVKMVKAYPEYAKTITYRGKIKLHGTNSGIRVNTDGTVVAQSRNQDITPENDNAGFARWVDSNLEYWSNLKGLCDFVVFGEWCGPGIMKGTAINQIPNKVFAVFAILAINEDENKSDFIYMPDSISYILNIVDKPPKDVFVLPWTTEEFDVNYSNTSCLSDVATKLSEYVDNLEQCDPWVKEVFGVTGVAEGVVYYPYNKYSSHLTVTRHFFSHYCFKAKGEKHKVAHTKQTVQVDPEVLASVDEFVSMFVTEQRCEQGVTQISSMDVSNIGKFLKWMCEDVMKESVAELEANGLVWKQVQSAVQNASRKWFLSQVNKV